MMPKSISSLQIAPLILALILVKHCTAVSGPVYVNPNAPVQEVHVQPTKVSRDPSTFETQTVYGFLDFTTTIGHTIMVFSSNSAPPPEPPKPPQPALVTNVIETKPPEQVVAITDIKPSKASSSSKHTVQEVSSVIQVVASSPEENVIVEKPKQNQPSSKVQIVSSQIDVVTERKEDKLLEHINFVKAVPSVISSHVEVQESVPSIISHVEKPKPVILSSIVEVRSSEEEDDVPVLQVENNIGEPH